MQKAPGNFYFSQTSLSVSTEKSRRNIAIHHPKPLVFSGEKIKKRTPFEIRLKQHSHDSQCQDFSFALRQASTLIRLEQYSSPLILV